MLTSATISEIIGGIQTAIAEAPKVVALYNSAKTFISGLFGAGLISAKTQDDLHQHVDALQAAHEAGQEPPAWTVEPDPA
jgi:hypothetical protein